jgi:hypothetical protein
MSTSGVRMEGDDGSWLELRLCPVGGHGVDLTIGDGRGLVSLELTAGEATQMAGALTALASDLQARAEARD